MLPVIYKYFPTKFKSIIEELHVNKINFNNIDYVCDDIILNEENTFLRNTEDRNIILDCYKNMINNLLAKIDRCDFVSAVLEIFPNKDKTGGHAVTLIKGISNIDIENGIDTIGKFYIIDDQNSISELSDYYNSRKEKLFEITIRDIDEITIVNINAIFHAKCDIDPSCKFSKRVTRYVLNFEHNFLSTTENLLKPELSYTKVKISDALNSTNTDSNLFKLIFIFISGLIIGLIIGILSKQYLYSQPNETIKNSNRSRV